ncbi:DUF4783 domain-containing protein [Bacteroidales bacterium OttesenSCG-928-J16]|nr:DUF4783 domain-containing protein [Bacteroidales bacterium OttesenSCG-928-J16]
MKKIGFIIFSLWATCYCAAQTAIDEAELLADQMQKIFMEEDFSALGKVFAPNVYLAIPAYNRQCSSPQAVRILKEFFLDKKISLFEASRKEEVMSGAIIVAAEMTAGDTDYDLFFLFKGGGEKNVLTKLTIKKKQSSQ